MTLYRFKDIGFKPPEGASLIKASDVAELDSADSLLTQAQMRASVIVQEAEQHFEEERARGLREGREESDLAAVERLLSEHNQLNQKLGEIEASLAGLVSACVRKIIHSFSDSDLAEQVVHSALTQMRRESRVQIRLPHALMEDFNTRVEGLITRFPEIELIDLIEDASLTAPNVIVESTIGRIDCNLGHRLDELEMIITKVAGNLSTVSNQMAQTDD